MVVTENLHSDLQAKQQGCAESHVLGGRGAGKEPGWLWPGTGLDHVCFGGRVHQQGKLHSVRSYLVPSVCVTMLIKSMVCADGTVMVQDMAFYVHLCYLLLHSLGHIPQPLCPGQQTSSILSWHVPYFLQLTLISIAVHCLQSFGYVSLRPGTTQGLFVAVISLIVSALPNGAGAEGDRTTGLGWSWLTKSIPTHKKTHQSKQLVPTLPHFPVRTVPSLTTVILHSPCNWDALRFPDICHGVFPWDYSLAVIDGSNSSC